MKRFLMRFHGLEAASTDKGNVNHMAEEIDVKDRENLHEIRGLIQQ